MVLLDGDARIRPRSPGTVRVHFGIVRPFIECWASTRGHLREITSSDVDAVLEPPRGHRRYNAIMALCSLFRFAKRRGLTLADPTAHLSGGRGAGRTLDDIDLPSRRITLAGHRQRLGELTHHALLAWLGYRRATWPDTANRHVLVSRISALGTRPVSPDYLDKHLPRDVCLEHIRRDRILQEALAAGADPLHLSLVFNIDHTNAMAYANARNLLGSPAEQALSHAARNRYEGTPSTRAGVDDGRYGR